MFEFEPYALPHDRRELKITLDNDEKNQYIRTKIRKAIAKLWLIEKTDPALAEKTASKMIDMLK